MIGRCVQILQNFLNVSWYGSLTNNTKFLSDGTMNMFWSLTTSGFVFGGMAGSFTFNLWAEWIGRCAHCEQDTLQCSLLIVYSP